MKKFVLNRFSKRSLFGIFFVLLMMIFFIILGNASVVYASGGSGTLFENNDFEITKVYKEDNHVYLDVTSKLGTYGNNGYIRHLNFEECTGTLNGSTSTYSLTLMNSSSTGYYYSTKEIYCVDNLSIVGGMNFKFTSIGEYDISSGDVRFNTTNSGVKTLVWANAYGWIQFDKYPQNLMTDGGLGVHNWACIYFNLCADGYGEISPSQLNSLRFEFKDDNSNWVTINSNFSHQEEYVNDIDYLSIFTGNTKGYYCEDAYVYELSQPSRTDGLSNKFRVNMYGSGEGVDSPVFESSYFLNSTTDYPTDVFNYVIDMHHCPKFNSGATKGSNKVDNFAILQFSFWSEECELIGASLYDTENPIFVIEDENGNEKVITINENGEIVDASGFSVNSYGVVINDETGEEVHANDRNDFKTNPDESFWEQLFPNFSKIGSTFKTILTIVLGIIALLIILKIINIVVKIFKKKE